MESILIAVLAALLAGGAAYLYAKRNSSSSPLKSEDKKGKLTVENSPAAKEILIEAKEQAFKVKKDSEEEALKIKRQAQEEARKIVNEARAIEQKISSREETIERRAGALEEREKIITDKLDDLSTKMEEIEKIKQDQVAKLERAAGLTREEAKKLITEAVESRLKSDISRQVKEAEEMAKVEADKKAREIVIDAMVKGFSDYVPEYTTSTVKLPDDEMKGKIIGKEGRNIRTLEDLTGVDFDIDETPGVIRLSCFDPVRREIAKVSLERLIADGRIQPARIEEIVDKTSKDIDKIMHEEGEKITHSMNVYNLPRPVVDALGRFKYRYSYGQNLITHSTEVARIGVALAKETGADANIVKMGGLLHDIGKVFTEQEGTHVQLGVEFLNKHNIDPRIVACVAEHHQDKPFSSLESMLVYISDAISGGRPGARRENVEDYVKRVTELEKIASKYKGVDKAFAISAGREVRVLVIPKDVADDEMPKLANDIAQEIQDNVIYPGQVKVTVIRESRQVAVAK